MPNIDQIPRPTIENRSKQEALKEDEEIDYDIEWKVIADKQLIISDIITRLEFI
jgi:hypothetical protein